MNEKNLMSMDPVQRLDYLQTNADHIEEGEYFQSFGEEDIQDVERELADAAMKLDTKQEEFKEVKADFKNKIDVLKADFTSNLKNLKQKGERVKGKLFLFADQESKMMNTFDKSGQLVHSRRLKPEEKQLSTMSIARNASNV